MPIGVYLIAERNGRKTYIGYSTDVKKRVRAHHLKLSCSAKYTKSFKGGVRLLAHIQGFSSKRMAMSYEWFAKRRWKLNHFKGSHKEMRFLRFLKPLFLEKFRDETLHVTVYRKTLYDICKRLHPKIIIIYISNKEN